MRSVGLPIQTAVMEVMTKAVLKAAKGLSRDFSELENLQVSRKSNNHFVTTADFIADKILKEELLYARPDYSLISEESEEVKGKDPFRWIIDPIDGTVNFIHGIPNWSISIALEDLEKNEIVAGMIFDPIKHDMFCSEKGAGAYLNDRRLRVSCRRNLKEALVAVRDLTSREVPLASKFCAGVRKFGSTTLHMAYVAAGKIDAFFVNDKQNKNLWDTAAGGLIVKEAGGILLNQNWQISDNCTNLKLATTLDLLPALEQVFK